MHAISFIAGIALFATVTAVLWAALRLFILGLDNFGKHAIVFFGGYLIFFILLLIFATSGVYMGRECLKDFSSGRKVDIDLKINLFVVSAIFAGGVVMFFAK